MNALVYTAAQVVAMFPPELEVSEYWVNRTARRHNIGTIIRRKRVYTLPQVEQLVELQAVDAQQPKPTRKTAGVGKPRPAKPKPDLAANAAVTPLRARPDRARSYRGTA
ncbi:hypothetical protein AB0L65_32725 [Nonomuraea sp. NPDC052116]|uniref:hypothetical protein n=1 Tax=Nonomuraea sp. NPDC052116 TaxID=3155665 RepID=UPI003439A8D5